MATADSPAGIFFLSGVSCCPVSPGLFDTGRGQQDYKAFALGISRAENVNLHGKSNLN